MNYNKKLSKEELKRLYIKEGKPIKEIAKLMEIGSKTIENWLNQYEISTRSSIKIPRKRLEKLYINEKRSASEIADLIGVSKETISNWIKNYNLSNKLN